MRRYLRCTLFGLAASAPASKRMNAEATAFAAAVNSCVDELVDAVHACVQRDVPTTVARDAGLVRCMAPVVDRNYDALGIHGAIVCVSFLMLPLDKEPDNDNKWLVHAQVINWYARFQALLCPGLEGDDEAEGPTVQGSLSFGCDGRKGFQDEVAKRFKDFAISDETGPATKGSAVIPSTEGTIYSCTQLAGGEARSMSVLLGRTAPGAEPRNIPHRHLSSGVCGAIRTAGASKKKQLADIHEYLVHTDKVALAQSGAFHAFGEIMANRKLKQDLEGGGDRVLDTFFPPEFIKCASARGRRGGLMAAGTAPRGPLLGVGEVD